jgi:hypothetical protein
VSKSSPKPVVYSKDLFEYGRPSKEYLETEDADISIEAHLDCQSNHKYLEGSLFIETRNGKSIKYILFEKNNGDSDEKFSLLT